jgi:hypothetical protein
MKSAIEAGERLIELVRGNDDIVNHVDGCDAKMLAIAERELGVKFPPSYRRVVEEFGTWDIAGEECQRPVVVSVLVAARSASCMRLG